MKEQKFIINEVKKHLQASARKNKYRVIDAVQENADVWGVYTPPTTSLQMEGTKYPVNVEDMYIYCDGWDEFYNETVAKVAQAILEAEQIKEA